MPQTARRSLLASLAISALVTFELERAQWPLATRGMDAVGVWQGEKDSSAALQHPSQLRDSLAQMTPVLPNLTIHSSPSGNGTCAPALSAASADATTAIVPGAAPTLPSEPSLQAKARPEAATQPARASRAPQRDRRSLASHRAARATSSGGKSAFPAPEWKWANRSSVTPHEGALGDPQAPRGRWSELAQANPRRAPAQPLRDSAAAQKSRGRGEGLSYRGNAGMRADGLVHRGDARQAAAQTRSPRETASGRSVRSTLADLLGPRPIRPPPGEPRPPNFRGILVSAPATRPDGSPARWIDLPLDAFDQLSPPRRMPEPATNAQVPHWHAPDWTSTKYFHVPAGLDGGANAVGLWAAAAERGWSWVIHNDDGWWALALERQPLLYYAGHWWWKREQVWFLLHDGRAWAYRQFGDAARSGLIEPRSGTKIIYSRDGKTAVVENGARGPVVLPGP